MASTPAATVESGKLQLSEGAAVVAFHNVSIAFEGKEVLRDAKAVIARSIARYVELLAEP